MRVPTISPAIDISAFIPFGSPLLTLIDQVRERRAPVNEYRVDLSSPRLGADKLVDLYVAPVLSEPGSCRRRLPGTLDGRQDRPAADAPGGSALRHRSRLDAGA